jgi:NADH-quinone oxidoreductase subunit J
MTSFEVIFWLLAAFMVASAVGVVASRNAVHSAVALVISFISMAGLFLLMGAVFAALLQILVYAGAVMVLFLFVVMLLDLPKTNEGSSGFFYTVGATLVALLLGGGFWTFSRADEMLSASEAAIPMSIILKTLFTEYGLAFELVALILLVATVGVVLISKEKAQ